MNRPRKLSHPESEVTKLKVLWRDALPEAEQDYWREQFASTRTLLNLREELQSKYNIKLTHNEQLRRFCHWVEDEDLRKEQADDVACDRAELEGQGLTGKQLRDELVRRMKERALARGDFKLGEAAVRLDLRAESVGIHDRWLALQVRKVDVMAKSVERETRPGGLTPEVLRQIEKDLRLM